MIENFVVQPYPLFVSTVGDVGLVVVYRVIGWAPSPEGYQGHEAGHISPVVVEHPGGKGPAGALDPTDNDWFFAESPPDAGRRGTDRATA